MTKVTYTGRLCLAFALLLLLPILSQAQVAILATDHVVQPDQEFDVDIKAADFNGILGAQFSVAWDSASFNFIDVVNVNEAFSSSPLDPFGTTFTDNGKLGFQWADFALNGISLGDTAVLFSIRLKTIETFSGESEVYFTDTPTAVEVADTSENVLNVDFSPGTITIDGISDLLEQNASRYVKITSNPNPFKDITVVTMEWMQAANAQVSVLTPAGQVCFNQRQQFQPGTQQLRLPEHLFSQAGVYLLKVQSTDFVVTYKLIAI
jgi:hypothetical protein